MVNNNIVPPLLEAVLVDYNRNVPDARDAEVLNVMTTIIGKLNGFMEDKVPIIMENVFECTLEMINKDFSEYPQHRVEFFKLLKAINFCCFPALLKLDGRQFKFVIDSCLWASKHDNREVENTGLTMCLELIDNMAGVDQQTSALFFRQFYITILQDVFFVLTDTDHKAGMCSPLKCFLTWVSNILQVSKPNLCSLPECSISLRLARSPNRSMPRTKHQQELLTRISYGNLLAISFTPPSLTCKRRYQMSFFKGLAN